MQKDDSNFQDKEEQATTIIQSNAKGPQTTRKDSNKVKPKKAKTTLVEGSVDLLRKYFGKVAQQQALNNQDQLIARTQFVKNQIATLNHKDAHLYSKILKESLNGEYPITEDKAKRTQILSNCVRAYREMIKTYRDSSVNPTIIVATYDAFEDIWKQLVQSEEHSKIIFEIWKFVPHQQLSTFLEEFKIMHLYHSIPFKVMFTFISTGLFDNKIQQYCEYYKIYKANRSQMTKQLKEEFNTFEYEQIIPRISKKDQLFTEFTINLIKNDSSLAEKVLEGLDLKQYEKVVHLTGGDVSKHPRILKFAMRRHYKDIARRKIEWYIIQDKLSFSQQFTRWFADSIAIKFKLPDSKEAGSESEGILMCYGINSEDEAKRVRESILVRGKLAESTQVPYLENPLYEKDDFIPAQFIINNNLEAGKDVYLTLEHFKLTKDQIIMVDAIDETFAKATKHILSAELVGFDSEFWATATKYEEGGISIIQLALKDICYIFDYHSLKNSKQFDSFFIDLMQKSQIVKVGHTISSDIQYLYRTFMKKINFSSFVDLVKIKAILYPTQTFGSLAYMCDKFVGKTMCKYEQRGNWNRRPLKKTQIYYAALDSFVCIAILQKIMSQKNISLKEITQLQKPKNVENKDEQETQDQLIKNAGQQGKIESEFDFQKFKDFMVNPIFLVDNMLKKLCSTMRNCGIDAEFISIKDYDLAVSQAIKEKRILITRDSKIISKRHINIPIYLLKERSDTDLMFKQLTDAFRIDLSQYKTLSRCVKCNSPELIVIPNAEAKKEITFIYEDSDITQFWRCNRCKQIYWQGGQFKKAKVKYEQFRK